MAQGLTLEQLKSMGAKPVTAPAQTGGGLTLEQLQSMGAKPVTNKLQVETSADRAKKFYGEDSLAYKATAPARALENFGTGVGSAVGKFVTSIPETAFNVTSYLGKLVGADTTYADKYAKTVSDATKKVQENIYEKPFEQQLNTGAGQAGNVAGTIAPYFTGGGEVKAVGVIPKILRALGRGGVDATISGVQSGGDVNTAGGTGATTGVIEGVSSALPTGKVTGTMSKLLRTLAPGYAGDVSMGLSGQRGENREGTNALIPGMGTVLSGVLGGAGKAASMQAERTATAGARKSEEVNTLLGRVFQGEKGDTEAILPAFSNLVKDKKINFNDPNFNYSTFKKDVSDRISEISGKLDEGLDTKIDVYPLSSLGTKVTSGKTTVTHNFVSDALDQLDDFYKKTNNPARQSEIALLKNKAETTGLTVREINDIARLHGQEMSGYNANGQLASGLSKQAAENTRKGLKTTARDLFGDETSKAADLEITGLIKMRDLITDIESKANDLKQRIIPRKFGEEVSNKILSAIDTLTNGGLRGIAQWIIPRGKGDKLLNALDMEKALSKNIEKISKLLDQNLPEQTLMDKLDALIATSKKENESMLLLPAPKDTNNYNVNQGRPIIVAPKDRQMDIITKDTGVANQSALTQFDNQPSMTNTMTTPSASIPGSVTPSGKNVKPDRRQQLIDQLRAEYEPYTNPAEMPTIEMGNVPKKKSTIPVLNADKMNAPEVAVPVVPKTKKKVQSETQKSNKIAEMSAKYKNPIEFSDAAYRNMYETGNTGLPVLFRGEGKPSKQRVLGDGGKYFAQTETIAEQYGKIKAYSINENAKILDIAKDSKTWNKIKDKNVSEELKKLGYDGVMDSKNYAHGTMIVNDSITTEIPGVKSIKDLFNKNKSEPLFASGGKKVDNKKVSEVLKEKSSKVENLEQEAKKYKSADEFRDALDINYEDNWKGKKDERADELLQAFKGKYFHGSNAVDKIKTEGFKKGQYWNSGVYFANTPAPAIDYSKQARSSGKVSDIIVSDLKGVKIKQLSDAEGVRAISKANTGSEELVAKLKKQGYDGVRDSWETLVWNPEKIKDKDTLSDIWNKQQGEVDKKN